jgi:AraC family transcriptional regulator
MGTNPGKLSAEFQGETVCYYDFGGIVLHASSFRRDAKVDRHQHNDAYACFLAGGPLNEKVGSRSWNHRTLTLIVHPAGEEHEDFFEGPGLCVNLKITSAWIKTNLEAHTPWVERRAFEHGPLLFLGLNLFRIYSRREIGSISLDVEELVSELFSIGHAVAPCRIVPTRISRVLERLEADPAFPPRLSECAKLADVHPVYLARAFRKCYGMSLGEYQRQSKIRQAVTLLTDTHLPISDIASDCGFFDQSHLTNMLRSSTGFTPSELRRSYRAIRL